MQNEDDHLITWDDSGAEFIKIQSMFNESVRQIRKLIRCTHANEVRSNATCSAGDMGKYVPPQVRRSGVSVKEEHNRLLLGTLCWCSIYVGHFRIDNFDTRERKGEVGGYLFFHHLR